MLDGVVTDEVVERVWRLDKLDQPARLPLDQSFLELFEPLAVELLSRLGRPCQQPLEIHQVQARGQVGQLLGGKVGQVAELAVVAVIPGREFLAGRGVGHRDLERCHMALPISRSLISASWSHKRQNAMLLRLM